MTSASLFTGCVGAAAHIVRPGERIPAPEQIRIGLIVGDSPLSASPWSRRPRS